MSSAVIFVYFFDLNSTVVTTEGATRDTPCASCPNLNSTVVTTEEC